MVTTTRIALVVIAFGFFGCSGKQEVSPTSSSAATETPRQPRITLAVEPPIDPQDVKAGLPLDVVCTVTIESGGFEPSLVIFQVAESKNKKKVVESYTVSEKKSADNSFTFTYHAKAPQLPGRFAIDAKVIGVDTSLPPNEPAQAPAADGTKAKQGACAEFNAPSLEVEVKK